jgi:cyclophilin family peptidyl-prolyl cis-trans isomerase
LPRYAAPVAIAAIALLAVGIFVLTRPPGSGGSAPGGSPTGATESLASKRPLGPPAATPIAVPPAAPAGDGTTATIKTSLGDITMDLFTASAPVATQNFINLAEAGFYDHVVFHRLVPGFVIQGGDPKGNGSGGPGYTIQDEPVVGTYARGIVAMARTQQPNSQGSQFFIVLDDAARQALDSARTYVIFGRVTAGMDVVDKIAAMPNKGEAAGNQAVQPVPMTTVTIKRP